MTKIFAIKVQGLEPATIWMMMYIYKMVAIFWFFS